MNRRVKIERPGILPFIIIYIFLSAGLVLIGYSHYSRMKSQVRHEVEEQLSSIGELKVQSMMDYRNERMGDAAVVYKNSAFSSLMRRYFLLSEDSETGNQLRAWIRNIQVSYPYDMVMLVDTFNNVVMTEPDESGQIASYVSPENLASLNAGNIVFEDFYLNEQDRRIFLKVLVPILNEANEYRLMGILALRIDPEEYLYPFISAWPTPSGTAETLLVRRDGEDVLFLNELRFREGSALTLREPLSNTRLPAAMAVGGQEGIVEGVDYHGVPVIAYVHAVPGSPWFLVARIDTSEVYAPMRERLWTTVSFLAILLSGLALLFILVWKQQQILHYRDRLKAAEALRDSEATARVLLNTPTDVAALLDLGGNVLDANEAMAIRLKTTVDKLIGKRLWDYLPDDIVKSRLEMIAPVYISKRPVRFEDERNGRWFDNIIYPVLDADGNVSKIAILARDMTERINAEAERLLIIRELEAKNTELERFTYTASHDLKSPVITVKGYVGIVRQDIETGNNELAGSDLSRIEHAADKMLLLLDDLLELSRIGRVVNPLVSVSISDIAKAALEQTSGEISRRGIRITVADEMPVVKGDMQRLTEVMQNLIENAVKFMGDQADPLIEIGCREENGEVVFFVRDNGIGIETRFQEKIFGIFDKLNPDINGTGVGLAIVKRIIEIHGGRIWVESEGLGKGSTFKFTFPVEEQVPEDHGETYER